METQLKEFSIKFFKELGANVLDSGDSLEITGVPQKFQKFYGKNEPYKLVFDKNLSTQGTELITSESYLLKMMRSYLDNSGEAVLLSLNYKLHMDSFIKENLNLINCSLVKANNNALHNFLFKFTFQTTYKYLNEEEKLVNEVYVAGSKIKILKSSVQMFLSIIQLRIRYSFISRLLRPLKYGIVPLWKAVQ
jgi:hypothetical protein